VRHAEIVAKRDAAILYGTIYVIYIVIGNTARHMKLDLFISIINPLIYISVTPQFKFLLS
jgi:hypothetical protein